MLPYCGRAERLWRTDHVYDQLVVLGYNDEPVAPGAGSAIFLHLAKSNYAATEGCIAIAREDMAIFLGLAAVGDLVRVLPAGAGP